MYPRPDGERGRFRLSLPRVVSIPLILLLLVASLALAWQAVRLAWADVLYRRGTPELVARALKMDPGNARYHARMADADASRAEQHLRAAVALNPYDSDSRIELGLRAEVAGDLSTAEQYLSDAARLDHTYEPRWTMANFYFRRGDRNQFWTWARRAAEMAYHDQSALFDLCWRISDDPEEIAGKLLPDRPRITAQYLGYLLERNRLDAAVPMARRVLAGGRREDLPLLFTYCDRMIQAGREADAVEAWNGLARPGWTGRNRLAPARGEVVTNGDFAGEFLSRGFDWRAVPANGVSAVRSGPPDGLRISLSGRQPERCALLEQYVPLPPARALRFRVHYRTSGVGPASGIRWRVMDAGGKITLGTSGELANDSGAEAAFVVMVPPGVALGRLVLEYERMPGAMRTEGSLWLESVGSALVE